MIGSLRIAGYRIPDRQASDADALRVVHVDLRGMTRRDLYAESRRVATAYAHAVAARDSRMIEIGEPPYLMPAVDWLEQRLAAVQTEERRRGRMAVCGRR